MFKMWFLLLTFLLPEIVSGQNQSCAVAGLHASQVRAFSVAMQWDQGLADCGELYTVCWTITSSTVTQCVEEPVNSTAYTVEGLVPCTNYTIHVSAAEESGNLSDTAAVTVRTIPRSVFFLNATEAGPGQVRLNWVHLFVGGECSDQFLLSWTDEQGLYTGTAYAPNTTYEHVVSGLASCTNYTFSIAMLDWDGRASEPLSTSISTDMLSSVLNVNTVDVSSDSFDMVWTRPADSASSQCAHWFQPCCGRLGSDLQQCMLVDRNVTTARVTGSEPCTEYNVSVATVSERSSHTAFWQIHVSAGHNGTVIRALQVVERTQVSMHLLWEPLYPGLPCAMAYRLCWNTTSCVILHTDVTSHNITGLQPGTAYELHLVALFDTDDVSAGVNVTAVTDTANSAAKKISLSAASIFLAILFVVIPNALYSSV